MAIPRLFKKPAYMESDGPHDPRRLFHYGFYGTINESLVRLAVESDLGPVIVSGGTTFFRGQCICRQVEYRLWDADIEYLLRPADMGTWTWDLDGTGIIEQTKNSLETIAKYPAATAPDFETLIGVEDDNVLGAENIKPFGRFTVTFNHPAGFLSLPYAYYLMSLDGYVNSALWFGVFQPGEVRYMGTRSQNGTDGAVSAVYQFEIQKNRTNFTVGQVAGIDKKGWHLIWIKYKNATKTVGAFTFPVKNPVFVYIERMSETINFATAFGFG